MTGDGFALRPFRGEDVPAYVGAFREDTDLGRMIGTEEDPDERSARTRVEVAYKRADEGTAFELAIADPKTDAFWGTVIAHSFDWHHRRCEVGFLLVPAARRRGVASAVVAAMLHWAFVEMDLLRVEMTTTPDNEAVAALARRLGFTREGVLRQRNVERGRRVDIVWFGLLREEWEER
jgi:RimJ/RimL family protein N-acetyltransferase